MHDATTANTHRRPGLDPGQGFFLSALERKAKSRIKSGTTRSVVWDVAWLERNF